MLFSELFKNIIDFSAWNPMLIKLMDTFWVLFFSFLLWSVSRWFIRKFVTTYVQKTKTTWDDILLEKRVFSRLSRVFPPLILQYWIPQIFSEHINFIGFFTRMMDALIIFVFIQVFVAATDVAEHQVKQIKALKDKPVSSYFQLIKVVVYFFGIIWMIGKIINKDPMSILAAFGAVMAIVLLIFKDTILGFVASIQIAANDLIRIDDWISSPKYGADGNVVDITLNSVKVRNFDRTITTIPTYALISDSFKNYRFMGLSNTRRIKRSIIFSTSSVQYCDIELLNRLEKIDLLSGFIQERRKEIEEHNKVNEVNTELLINGRNLTNIGLFRYYVEAYLRAHKQIDDDSTQMVFQLSQTEKGIPLQVYCFTNTADWQLFEEIQSDIFDHLYAAADLFNLDVYQQPSSSDLKSLRIEK